MVSQLNETFMFTVVSNFKFTLPDCLEAHVGLSNCTTNESTQDEDGDIVVQRKGQSSDHSLAIRNYIICLN